MADIWSEALRGLEPRLGEQTFDMWVRPIELREVVETDRALHLRAPNHFMKEWFETHYLDVVLDEIERKTRQRYNATVDVAPPREDRDRAREEAQDTIRGHHAPANAPTTSAAQTRTGPKPPVKPAAPVKRAAPPQGLSERYRFESFIKGGSNELAASAAWAVAQEPGQRFNPLFIYGGVGLGKTHLLHAVGHHLHETRPELRIVYLSAERFMNEFITAVRFNQFEEFRAKYRETCDVLLIDDIQFIAGRDRTMDEFFHVFNALYEAGKQIMVTSDRVPADMEGMEERLTSRLNWGLVADVKSPDLETRVAILRQKADQDQLEVDDRVLLFVASLVRSNVRELEGALVRIATFAELKGVPITEEFVRELLGDIAQPPQPQAITIERVQKLVASHFSLRVADLKGPRRHRCVSRPRMIAMYLSRELTGASFPEIGQRFGGKDHSTVINACKRITSISAEKPEFRMTVEGLRRQLCPEGAAALM